MVVAFPFSIAATAHAGVKKNEQGEAGIEQSVSRATGRPKKIGNIDTHTSSERNDREAIRFMPFPLRNCGGAQVSR
ncbi:hypothetical protein [Rhizobium gallicum]|nr:hypothetical protein [Rhizobium gallicum]